MMSTNRVQRGGASAVVFDIALASKLTGATPYQLKRWRKTSLLVPEVSPARPPLYSYRDLVALRSMVFLRAKTSSQKLTKAWHTLESLDVEDLADHPASYRFGTNGKTIYVRTPEGTVIDITKTPGNAVDEYTFEELFQPFENFKHQQVVNFERPAPHLRVHPRTLGGFPVVDGTRVPFDVVAQMVDDHTVFVDDIPDYFPRVSVDAARDAVEFGREIDSERTA